MYKIDQPIKYLSLKDGKIFIHYSEVLLLDEENNITELKNAAKIKFIENTSPLWSLYSNKSNNDKYLIENTL